MGSFAVTGVSFLDKFIYLNPGAISAEAPVVNFQYLRDAERIGGSAFIFSMLQHDMPSDNFMLIESPHVQSIRVRHVTSNAIVHVYEKMIDRNLSTNLKINLNNLNVEYLVLDLGKNFDSDFELEEKSANKLVNLRTENTHHINGALLVRTNKSIFDLICLSSGVTKGGINEKVEAIRAIFNIQFLAVSLPHGQFIVCDSAGSKICQLPENLASGLYIGEKFFVSLIAAYSLVDNSFDFEIFEEKFDNKISKWGFDEI